MWDALIWILILVGGPLLVMIIWARRQFHWEPDLDYDVHNINYSGRSSHTTTFRTRRQRYRR